jgi:hypothetical protein
MEAPFMDTDWIEAVMCLNQRILVTEARLRSHAVRLVEMMMEEQDTTEAEFLFLSSQRSLKVLRTTRDELLLNVDVKK